MGEVKGLVDEGLKEKFGWVDVLDSLPAYVTIHDLEFRFLFINKAAREAFPGAVLGRRCYEIIHGRGDPPPFCPLRATMQTGSEHSRIFYHEHLDRQFLVTTSALHDSEGKMSAIVHFLSDVTDVKEIENRYFQQKKISDFVFQKSPVGILVTEGSKILHANEAFIRISGYSRDELVGCSAKMFYKDEVSFRTVAEVIGRILPFEDVHGLEMNFSRKDGTEIPLKVSCRKVGGVEGIGRDLYIWVVEDMTQEKEVEKMKDKLKERVEQIQRLEALGILASGIAHDFNNILTPIIGYTELAEKLATSQQQKLHLELIASAANRAKDLIDNLLKFSKGQQEGHVPFDISEVLRRTIKLLKVMIPSSVLIKDEVQEMDRQLIGNPSQLDEILVNLCINALHAMDGKGELRIGCRKVYLDSDFLKPWPDMSPGDYVHIYVTDTGCGMDENTKSRIFDPYFTTKGPDQGTGLGLTMVFHGVKSNNGFIDVESEPGLGSTFHLYFPLPKDEGSLPFDNALHHLKDAKHLKDVKILLVDDDESVLSLASEFLEYAGATVKSHLDPVSALNDVESSSFVPHVLVTDLTMPGLRGDQLIRRCRRFMEELPAVIITGYGRDGEDIDAEAQVVKKPFRIAELVKAINAAMGSSS